MCLYYVGEKAHMSGKRRSIRLKNYDYTRKGAYYVTMCANNRKCMFGNVRNGEMGMNDTGNMIDKWWRELRSKYPMVEKSKCFRCSSS